MQTKPGIVQLLKGMRDELPILLGVVPFGMIYGALAVQARLPGVVTQAMSSLIFAGSSQLIFVQLLGAGASAAVILLVVFVVNLRHALYSASIAPHLKSLPPVWKYLLAYLLTDEAYAVAITNYNRESDPRLKHWYFLGAGAMLWSAWQVSTAVGIVIGERFAPQWTLEFALPLTFIALVVPGLRDRAMVVAALVAGVVGLLCAGFPYKTGLLLAALLGIAAGLWVERRPR